VPGTAFVTGGSGFVGGRLIRRLIAEGTAVRALARSDASAEKVAALGAEPVRGDLEDAASLRAGAGGCEVTYHAAAEVSDWGRREDFVRANVTGTEGVLAAARDAGVRRFVHVGTESALMVGKALVNVDETDALHPESPLHYPATKAMAEQAVRAASRDGFETVVVRPRLIWGAGDTTILPVLVEAVEKGRFSWVGGGHHLTSTAHIDNVVEGLVLAARAGVPGEAYFVTDGDPLPLREFVTKLLATRGIAAPSRSIPGAVARSVAWTAEAAWRVLPLRGVPPITRLAIWNFAMEMTVNDAKARRELGYAPVTTIEQGLEEMRRLHESETAAAA